MASTNSGVKLRGSANAVFSMPGYTGHVKGMYDTIGVTPGHAQYKAAVRGFSEMDPDGQDPVPAPRRDPCNDPTKTFKKHSFAEELWPSAASNKVLSDAEKPYSNKSHLVFGDPRFFQRQSHYSDVHANATTASGAVGIMDESLFQTGQHSEVKAFEARRPKRLADLSKEELIQKYELIKKRISEEQLKRLEDNLKLRLSAKQTNDNVNGKRMHRMFLQFDEDGSGFIDFEEFHKGLLSYGIQFEPEQCLRLFAKYDPNADGFLSYIEFMREIVESQYFNLAFNGVGVQLMNRENVIADYAKQRAHKRLLSLRQTILGYVPNNSSFVRDIFTMADGDQEHGIDKEEFGTLLEKCGFSILKGERDLLFDVLDTVDDEKLTYEEFIHFLFPEERQSSKKVGTWE